MYKLAIILTLVFVGCSDDGKNTTDPSNNFRDLGTRDFPKNDKDLGTDTTADDAGNTDDVQSDMQTNGCAPALNTTIDIQEKDQIGQLYARASWSDTTGWIVYAAPANEGEPEAIFLTRLSCEGAVLAPPIQISPATTDRHLHPVIASKGGNTFVAWYSQVSGGGQTSIWLQSYKEDGTKNTVEPIDITPKNNNGAPLSNLIWEPAIAAISGDEIIVGYSYGSTEGFKVAIQKVNKTGVLGELITPIADTTDQKTPSLGADDEGNISLSWIRDDGTERVSYIGNIPAGATQLVPASGVPSKPLTTPNALARVTKESSDSGLMFQAFQVSTDQRSDVLVRNATNLSSAQSLTFGLSQRNSRASIASGKSGGAVAWYRSAESPSRGKVILQAFNDELVGGSEVTFDMVTEGIAPFGPDIAHVQDDIYLISWSEGDSGREAEVKARFVKLSAP